MAQTFTDAFAEVEGQTLDHAAGFVKPQPQAAEVDPVVAALWGSVTQRTLIGISRTVSASANVALDIAEDAVQATFERFFVNKPERFREEPQEIFGLVVGYASKQVLKNKADRNQGNLSLDMLLDMKMSPDGEEQDTGLATARPVVAYSKMGVDEDARFTPPPEPGANWERLQLIGAVQRFRDDHGRAPKTVEFKPEFGLPTMHTVKKLGFKSLADLLLESGVPVEVPARSVSRWTAREAAEACYRWRRRHGVWPGGSDRQGLPAGVLPSSGAMERYFGGEDVLSVQLGTEAILGPIDNKGPERREIRGGEGFPSMSPALALSRVAAW